MESGNALSISRETWRTCKDMDDNHLLQRAANLNMPTITSDIRFLHTCFL